MGSRQQAYDDAYAELPFHQGPLNVAQIITTGGRAFQLDARVTARSFFCSRAPAQRRSAVLAYYNDALAKVRRHGQRRLTLRVSRLTDSGVIRDVYAHATSSRDVALTSKGAGASPVHC